MIRSAEGAYGWFSVCPELYPAPRSRVVVLKSSVEPFPKERFLAFCSKLKILSKDFGLIPFKLLGTQEYILEEIVKGLNEGISTFVILKARQLGCSSFFIALDLFWAFEHAGLSGALATHTEQLRDQFRAMIEVYLAHLPKGFKIGYSRHNRTLLILKNTSMFNYLVAGTKENSKSGLGRGGAYNKAHCSEVAFWGVEDDISNLRSALSTHYAHRLQIFESTANGFNFFADFCETAQKSPAQRFIFVGWWRNNLYRYERDHPYFAMYYDGNLNSLERKRVKQVKEQYGIDIEPEQIAWVRWKLQDEFNGDQSTFDQEFPWVATDAFVATGSKFFSNESLTDAMRQARRVAFKPYKYILSNNWSDTGVVNSTDARAELKSLTLTLNLVDFMPSDAILHMGPATITTGRLFTLQGVMPTEPSRSRSSAPPQSRLINAPGCWLTWPDITGTAK